MKPTWINLQLSVHAALSSYTQPNLRAVAVKPITPYGLRVRWIFEGPITETNEDLVSTMMTEIDCDFDRYNDELIELDSDWESISSPIDSHPELEEGEQWAYHRYEGVSIALPNSLPELNRYAFTNLVGVYALLGCITANMRRVSLALAEKKAILRFYIDGEIGTKETELVITAGERLQTLLRMHPKFSDTLVQAEAKRVDVPHLMTRCSADRAVFNRYEDELINWSNITAEQEAELYSKEEFDLT